MPVVLYASHLSRNFYRVPFEVAKGTTGKKKSDTEAWGYPKLSMVHGKPYEKWMIWGYPYFRKPPYIYIYVYIYVIVMGMYVMYTLW